MVILIIMLFALTTKVSNVGYILTMLFYKYLTSIFLWQYFSSEERRAFSFCFIRCYKNLQTYYFGDIQEYAKYRFLNYYIQFDLV